MASESKSKKIFDLYVEVGLIDEKETPFEMWEKANPRQQKALFDLGVESKLFDPKDFEAFTSLWEVKKKDGDSTAQEEASVSVTQVQEDPGTLDASGLPTGSVVPGTQEEATPQEEAAPQTSIPSVSAVKSVDPVVGGGSQMTLSIPQNAEKDTWIERVVGKDTPILGTVVADFFGDVYRSAISGYQEGKSIPITEKLYQQGANISDADLEKYINAISAQQTYGISDEMRQYEKDKEEFGGGFFGGLAAFIKGRGQIAPQVMANSMARMLNPEALKKGIAGGILGAEAAIVAGQLGPQIGLPEEIVTVPTAFVGGLMGMAGLSTEKTMTMQQLINDELVESGLELSADNLRTILSDEEKMKSIKRKALRRGVTIGVINALTKVGSTKAAGALLSKEASKQLGRTGSKLAAGTTAGTAEAVGEGFGEFAGQVAAGQEISGEEIFLEMIAGTAGAPTSLALGAYEASKGANYEINGGKATRADIFEILEDNDPQTIAAIKVNIENDNALSKLVADAKQEVKENAIIKRDVQQAGVTDEADAAKMVELEKEKRKLQNNQTTAGKRRIKELDAEIEAILDKTKPAETTTPTGQIFEIYEGVDRDGNKRQVEVTTTEEGVIEARLILENGERSQVVASAKGDVTPQSVYMGLFDESKPIELIASKETPVAGVDVETEAETTAETQEDVDAEASKDLQQMIDDAGMEVTSIETKETVAQEATPETETVTVVERKVNDNLSIADQDSKDTYYDSDQFAEENIEQDQDSHESMIMDRAKKAVDAVKKVAPNVKIVLHRNNNTYGQSTGSANSRAVYDAGTNTIHVNMPRAKESTIGHEVFHALLREKLGTDSKIQVATANMAKTIGKAINKSKKLTVEQKTELANYINQFNEETVQNEEAVAELLGVLSENYINLEPAQKGVVRRFIQKIIDLIGIDMDIAGKADADVINLLNTVSGKVARGQLIEEAEVAGIERAEQRKMNEAEISEVILTAYREGVNTEKTKSDLINLLTRRKAIREQAKDTEGAARDQRTIEDLAAIDMDQETPPMEIFYEREIEEQRQKDRDRREMDAYAQAERERSERIQNELPFGAFLKLHNELSNKGPKGNAKVHVEDFDRYGDPNLRSSKGAGKKLPGGGKRSRRGTGAMQVNRLLTKEGKPSLDTEIEAINDRLGTDFTPQDAIDYIMDRANNPGKYTAENVNLAERIEAEGPDAVLGPIQIDVEETTTPKPDQRTQRIDDVNEKVARIAVQNGINRQGFFPRTMNNPQGLRRRLEELGYGLKETRTKSGYFITKGGRKWNLPYRMRTQQIVPSEVQSRNVAGTKVPKGLSIRSVEGQQVVEGVDNMSVAKVREAAPLTFIKNANSLRGLDLVKGAKRFRPLPIPKSEKALNQMSPAKRRALLKRADEIYDTFVKQVSDNLVFLHDLYGDEFREISTLWYDGANQIAQGLAKKHNVSLDQVSGILASLSPQKDWYQNVRLAELVLEQYDTNPVFTQEALDTQKKINETGLQAALKKGKGRLTEKGKQNKANADKLLVELEGLVGKRLKDVDPKYQPYILRTTHEITGQKDYQIVSPDGERVGVAKKNDGTNAKVAWGSYTEIGKAVAIYLNGSPENISTQLGTAHKIRNFYDNIVDPMSEEGEVTMDTHAIAAATLLPVSGNSVEVSQNFGTQKASNSKAAGVSGLYYAYADAYADAAKRTGLLPRQMQSVTWEAVRGLFTDSFKNSKKNVNDVRDIFSNYAKGKISIDEARKQAVDRAGGIQNPSWAGSLLSDVTRDIEAESDVRGVRRDERSDQRSRTQRRREGDSKGDVRGQRDGIRTQQLPKRANAADVVNFGKRNNFTVSQIQDYLVNTMGLSAKDAKKITEANLGPFNEIPASFLDIGINDGFLLFDRMKEYVNKLKKDNVPVMKRLEMVQDFLEKQPEYIAQADKNRKAPSTIQAKMMVDVKDALGLKAKKNAAQRMRELKKTIRERGKGARDLQQIKRKLRNFMRETLPRDVYTRKDVLDMVRKISDVNKINLDRMIGEVESFVTEKQVAYLESEISNILNGKYEVTANGRRKGVKIDSETAARIANIRDKLIVGPEATAKDIVERNEKLNDRIRELSQQLNPTEEQRNEIVDLLAAMAINESKLSENNNPIKVTQLERANQILSETLDGGRQTFKAQIKKAHEKYKGEFVKVYKAITGIELDPNSENYKTEAQEAQGRMDRLAQERKLERGMKKYINTTIRGIKNFLRYGESLEGLMDIISEAPGALIEALPDELVYEKINDSSRTYKKRQLQNQKILTAKIKETFGRKWKKVMKRGVIQKNTHIYKNVERAKKAYDKYNRNRTIKNYYNWKKVEGEERIKLSPNEIAYFYQQYQDPANIPSFANPNNIYFGPDHANIMKQLVEGVAVDPVTGKKVPIKNRGIDPRLLDFSNWMVEEFFPSRYDDYNATYKDIYRTNMPWNQYYAGRIYREGKTYSALDLLGNNAVQNGVVNAASTKDRRANNQPIKPQDMFSNLYTYLEDMEWFAAYGSQLRDINKLFSNPLIRRAITSLKNGRATLDMIDHSIKNVAARGIQSGKSNDFVNWINKGFINAKLGLNPTIALKQMLSAPTYANDIGYANYLKYMFKDKASMLKNFNEIRKNSVYVQDRLTDDFRKKIEAFNSNQVIEAIPKTTKNYFANALMFFGRAGDIGAIFLGGMPNYAYYKDQYKKRNPQATEQEVIDYAIKKFERDTKTTQQSMDLQDRDYFQSSNALMRSLNMFLTTPKQYFRKELAGLRKVRRGMRDMRLAYKAKKAGVGDTKQIRQSGEQVVDGMRQFIQYHAFMPLAFQYVTMGLPGLLRDRREGDEDDLKRALLLGNINALFIIGDLIVGAADMYQNKSYAGNQTGLVPYSRLNRLANLYKWAQQSGPEKRNKWMNEFYVELGEVFLRLPVGNMYNFYKNIQKLDEIEDPREVVLRLMNYKDYTIEGPGDSFGSGGGSSKGTVPSKPTSSVRSVGGVQKAK